ncbi:hypothetical protein ACFFRE_02780 [Aciditerrimonas ferrireducens]|uniref:Uncharacterized protein n=1 Tax=Aciditerrimonas ferrireducens TaxID=667306 RepID=A0ABV6C076_9ACTN
MVLSGAALGLVGVGAVALPAAHAATTPAYTAQATGQGAQIDLFGTELTGASATVAVDTTAPSVQASGSATLTPGLVEQVSASANADGASKDEPYTCTQGGGTPAGTPVGASLGLACAGASASLSSAGVPSGSAEGRVTGVDASVTGLLGEILSSGGNTLVNGLEQLLGQLNATPLGTGTASCPSVTSSSSGSSGNPLSSLLGSLGSSSNPLTQVLGSLGLGGSGSNPLSGLTGLLGGLGGSGNPLSGLTSGLTGGLGGSLSGSANGSGSGLSFTPSSTGSGSSTPLSGLLGNLIQGLCQTLVNVQRVASSATNTLTQTVTVHLGPVSANVNGTDSGTATASASGSTADVAILPGVGCDAASLTACVSDPSTYAAPLIEIQVAPASASDSYDGSSWTPSATAALATIDLNIPGFRQQISLAPGQAQTLLAGTPLETVVDLGSTSVQGSSAQAEGASIDLLKGVNGGILLNLGSASVTGGTGTATPPKTSPGGGSSSTGVTSQVTTSPTGAQVTSATSVHTGAWWAGSLPYLAGAAGLGGLLLGWPRLRRSGRLARLLARSARR